MTENMRKKMMLAVLLGLLGCLLGLFLDARTMFASYLAAWTAVSAIPIGALAVLFTTYLVRAGWTRDLHVPLTIAVLTLPAVAILFIPVLAGMGHLYPWAASAADLPAFKATYLAPWFFVVRTILYFAVFTALALWGALAYGNEAAMKRAASTGLIVWALVASWAGIDWLESIEPHFHSSIYGLLAIAFDLLAGMSFGIVALLGFKGSRTMANAAYSGVLLSVLLLWAYLHAMQYIIIWTGNIPEEVVWYLKRLAHGWGFALWALYILQFILPFFALLSEKARSSTRTLLILALGTLALRYLESIVLILPPLKTNGFALFLDLPAAILFTGACWLLAFDAAARIAEQRGLSRAATAH
ncbi:MAG TPA: hypothetical protein VHD14_07030 [Pseudolabrys sp.]|nr:hypothetical protein [Pseudolabrys sp.]